MSFLRSHLAHFPSAEGAELLRDHNSKSQQDMLMGHRGTSKAKDVRFADNVLAPFVKFRSFHFLTITQ
jgi:hypothetical protein